MCGAGGNIEIDSELWIYESPVPGSEVVCMYLPVVPETVPDTCKTEIVIEVCCAEIPITVTSDEESECAIFGRATMKSISSWCICLISFLIRKIADAADVRVFN
jgi:hypothetical protein